jgi:hypothetical protein
MRTGSSSQPGRNQLAVALAVGEGGGMNAVPRPLGRRERETLAALLAVDFPGVEALRAQVPGTVVTDRCSCGCPSVSLEPPADAPPAAVVTSVPVDAAALGAYGEPEGLVMLFVHDGRLSYLEYAPTTDRTPSSFPPVHRIVQVEAARTEPEDPEP